MSKFLATLATLIIIVLIAALAAPYLIDWNNYRGVFETQASRLMGRPVRVGGNVGLNLLPTPEIRFEKVQIAGADGRFGEPFAEARAFTMVLSLGQLLSGAIEAKRVELVNPIFRFSVDANGRSNWGNLGASDLSEALLLAPREVTLKDVEISGGLIELHTPYDAEPLRLERITGKFDAGALNGPFKFSGRAMVRGRALDLRLSTGKYERGGLKLRAGLRVAGGGEDYLLDGDLTSLNGPLTYRGPLTAHVNLSGRGQGGADRSGADGGETLEIKSQSLLSLSAAKLDDLSLTVVRQDRPQTLTGSARAEWGARSRLELSLGTRLLDLEPFLPGGGRSASAEAAAALLPRLLGGLPFTPLEGVLKLDAEQLLIAGDAIENLSLELAKDGDGDGGKWRISAARARLPGDSQLSASGAFQDSGAGYQFVGAIDADGANLAKLLKWLAPDYDWAGEGEPQRFALRGKVTAGPGGAAIEGASGELAGSAFTGSGRYERASGGAGPGRLSIAMEASRLDLKPLFGEGEGLVGEGIGGLLGEGDGGESREGANHDKARAAEPGQGLWDALKAAVGANDSEIDLRASDLLAPGFQARNVAAKFRVRDGAVDISKLSVIGDGLTVSADGRLEHYRENPEGALRLAVQADRAASLKTLALFLGAPDALTGNERRLESLAPLRLEGSFVAARGSGQAELKLGGVAGASALSVTGKLKGKPSRLWEGQIGFSASVNNPSGADLLLQIAPRGGEPERRGAARAGGPGALSVKAEGSLKGLVEVNAELRTTDVEGRFIGKAAPSTKPWTMDGRIALKAQDAARILSMLDLASADAPLHGGLELNAMMSKSGGRYEFSNAVLRLENGRAEGRGTIDLSSEAPSLSATVASDEASLPRLLGLFVESSGPAVPGGALASDAVWPDRPFAFKVFDAMTGSLSLKAQTLSLGGGITLEGSQLEARLDQGALRLGKLVGRLWGGRFKADGVLTVRSPGKAAEAGRPAAGGARRASLTAQLSLDHADLKKLPAAADGRPLARGYGDLRLSLSGEGLSPHGLVAVLSGQGALHLEGGAVYGLSPQAIGKAAKTFLSAPKRPEGGIARLLGDEFKYGVFPYRSANAAVNVSNGVLQIAPTLLRSTRGAARTSLMLELSSMKADSEWELRGRPQKALRKADNKPDYRQEAAPPENWPPLKVVLAGPLGRFGALPLQIEADEFERSLTIRKMERDVERLEKLTPPAPPGRVQNDVASDVAATGATAPAPSVQTPPALPGPIEPGAATPGAGPVMAAPAVESSTAAPSPAAPAVGVSPPSGPAPTSAVAPTAASSWKAQTEDAPPGPGPGESVGGSASFESRMRNAIGEPEPSSRTGQRAPAAQAPDIQDPVVGDGVQDGAGVQQAPSRVPAGPGKQEAQAKKPAPKKSDDLFEWLR